MFFESSAIPGATYHKQQRGTDISTPAPLKHDFTKVNGLRAALSEVVYEAKQATARKENRAQAINEALSPFKSEKVGLCDLKKFVAGKKLSPKQYSALKTTFRAMEKEGYLPECLKNIPAAQQTNEIQPLPEISLSAK